MRRFDGKKSGGPGGEAVALPTWINEEWLKKFLEALMERGGSPADRESAAVIVAAARAFTARPFRWVREPRWWELAIRQRNFEKLVAEWKKKRAFEIRENERIREMIGNGRFVADLNDKGGTDDKHDGHLVALEVSSQLQAHTPIEQEMFDAVVKHYSGVVSATVQIAVVNGSLVATFAIPMPALEAVPAQEHPDNRTGIALKSDRDAERAKQAAAKEAAEKAAADAQAATADVAAKAGAAAAQEVLKNLNGPAAPSV